MHFTFLFRFPRNIALIGIQRGNGIVRQEQKKNYPFRHATTPQITNRVTILLTITSESMSLGRRTRGARHGRHHTNYHRRRRQIRLQIGLLTRAANRPRGTRRMRQRGHRRRTSGPRPRNTFAPNLIRLRTRNFQPPMNRANRTTRSRTTSSSIVRIHGRRRTIVRGRIHTQCHRRSTNRAASERNRSRTGHPRRHKIRCSATLVRNRRPIRSLRPNQSNSGRDNGARRNICINTHARNRRIIRPSSRQRGNGAGHYPRRQNMAGRAFAQRNHYSFKRRPRSQRSRGMRFQVTPNPSRISMRRRITTRVINGRVNTRVTVRHRRHSNGHRGQRKNSSRRINTRENPNGCQRLRRHRTQHTRLRGNGRRISTNWHYPSAKRLRHPCPMVSPSTKAMLCSQGQQVNRPANLHRFAGTRQRIGRGSTSGHRPRTRIIRRQRHGIAHTSL